MTPIEWAILGLLAPVVSAGAKAGFDYMGGAYDKPKAPVQARGFQPMSGTGRDSAAMQMLSQATPRRAPAPSANYGIGSSYAQNDYDKQRAASQMMWG